MKNLFDIGIKQCNYHGEHICGDTVVVNHYQGRQHSVIVLSDGMGHGVKANVLSTLSASILANLTHEGMPIETIATMILGNLPVCSVRKVSYATFSVIVVEHDTLNVVLSEYDNPKAVMLRGRRTIDADYDLREVPTKNGRMCNIRIYSFTAQHGDTLMVMSDGVAQSGLGSYQYPFGWGRDNVKDFVLKMLIKESEVSAESIASAVLEESINNDSDLPEDDISCVVLRF